MDFSTASSRRHYRLNLPGYNMVLEGPSMDRDKSALCNRNANLELEPLVSSNTQENHTPNQQTKVTAPRQTRPPPKRRPSARRSRRAPGQGNTRSNNTSHRSRPDPLAEHLGTDTCSLSGPCSGASALNAADICRVKPSQWQHGQDALM